MNIKDLKIGEIVVIAKEEEEKEEVLEENEEVDSDEDFIKVQKFKGPGPKF